MQNSNSAMGELPILERKAIAKAICESDETDKLEEQIKQLDSNDTRSDAKWILETCRDRPDPHLFANKLYRVLSSPLDLKSRTISAILLRKSLINKFDPHDSPFLRFPPDMQSTLKRDLLKLVDTPARPINKELCHTVSALAASLLPKKEWPEFLPFLFELVESDKKRALALLIVACLAQYLGKQLNKLHSVNSIRGKNLYKKLYSILLECLTKLHSFLLECLNTEGEDVRIAALGAAINFILCLEQKDLVNFQNLLSAMKNALYGGNETMANAVNTLKLLIDLAGMKPTFLRKQIVEMVKTIMPVADNNSLEKKTRRLAIEFVLTLVQFILTLAEVEKTNPELLKLGTEFEINMEEMWDDNEETDNYGSWQGCVGRLSTYRIRNGILTVVLEVLPAYLVAPEWHKEHAAFIVLTIVLTKSIESRREVTIENLKKIVPMVLSPFQNAHRHVWPTTIKAIPRLASYLLRSHWKDKVMRKNFEKVMSTLLSLFEDVDPVVQNESISAMRELALTLGGHFELGCHLVLPALAKVMNDSPNQEMRGSAASIILDVRKYCTEDNLNEHLEGSIRSCLIVSKEVEKLESAASAWQEWLSMSIRGADCRSHSWRSWHEGVPMEWVEIWRNEERDFSPFLHILMSPVFDSAVAQLDPDDPLYEGVGIIEKQAMVCHMLCFCVDELSTLLTFSLLDQVVDKLIPFLEWYHDPLLNFPPSERYDAKEIRIAAASAMPKILNLARSVVESSDPEDYDHTKHYFKMLSDKVQNALEDATVEEANHDLEVWSKMYDYFKKCKQI